MKYRVRQSVGRFKQQLADQQDEIRPGVPRPRLVTRHEAANYCRLSPQAFSLWVKEGRLPTALAGTARWDLKSIDAALDSASGLAEHGSISAFDHWKAKRARSS